MKYVEKLKVVTAEEAKDFLKRLMEDDLDAESEFYSSDSPSSMLLELVDLSQIVNAYPYENALQTYRNIWETEVKEGDFSLIKKFAKGDRLEWENYIMLAVVICSSSILKAAFSQIIHDSNQEDIKKSQEGADAVIKMIFDQEAAIKKVVAEEGSFPTRNFGEDN